MAVLAQRLRVIGMPSQTVIARECGVSQSTVSRASQGLIKTRSEAARKLWAYAGRRVGVMVAGGVQSQTAGVGTSTKPRRRPHKRTTATPAIAPYLSTMSKDQLVELAVAGLKEYLADAFDPLLVIEQISVLRRAQDRGAR